MVEDAVHDLQAKLRALESQGGMPSSGYHQGYGQGKRAMENKAVNGLKMQGSDRTSFRMWHEKLVNAFSQVDQGYRAILKGLTDQVDKHDKIEVSSNHDRDKWQKDNFPLSVIDMDKLNEDMFAVLMDKTEGDAWLRVRSVDSGNGLEAFVKLYWWFTGTSGQG